MEQAPETPEEAQIKEAAMNSLSGIEGLQSHTGGIAKKAINLGTDTIHDEYNLEQDTSDIKRQMEQDEDDEPKDGFLKVYDENKTAKEEDTTTEVGEIKTKLAEQESELTTTPTITEMSSTQFYDESQSTKANTPKKVLTPKFDWDTAERVDSKYQFMN